MSSLQSQLHDLHKEISRRDSEITTHQQTIKMMQEKQRYLSGEVSQHFSILLKNLLQIKKFAYQKNHVKRWNQIIAPGKNHYHNIWWYT